jgi:uncharacterized protein YecE (DUF72 family)
MSQKKATIRTGIGGWNYKPWRGTFYPDDLAQKNELAHAASRLATIEVNGTFYRTQKPATFARWAQAAPDGFRFSLKAPRYVVNRKRLDEAGQGITRFVESGIIELGEKLGPILWQLPASKSFDEAEFAAFLELLPTKVEGSDLRHVVELRHDSFVCAKAVELCRMAGVAIVLADSEDYPAIADITADFVYARLQRGDDAIETGYSPEALDAWAERFSQFALGQAPSDLPRVGEDAAPASPPRDVFVYFIREGKVRAPQAAMALQQQVDERG